MKQHDKCMVTYGDKDENVPNMTLDEYKAKIIGPILNKGSKGLKPISKDSFCSIEWAMFPCSFLCLIIFC